VTLERREPPPVADEMTMLAGWLDYHRATLRMKCDGLLAEQLVERSVPPSELSLLGLVRHMTEVERHWFRNAMEGERVAYRYCTAEQPDADFLDLDAEQCEEAIAEWLAEGALARQIVGSHLLDDLALGPPQGGGLSLRWIMTHMIEEYARHNGHADLIRERLDGAVGE